MLERASGGHATKAGAVFWVSGLVLALCAFWVSGGHALVRPEANKDAAGLNITHVETRIEAKAGHATLIVDGEARNRDHKARIMPPVAIAVTASTGTVLRYRMSAGSDLVAPDDVYLFSSRLRAPPEGVKSVAVTLEPAD